MGSRRVPERGNEHRREGSAGFEDFPRIFLSILLCILSTIIEFYAFGVRSGGSPGVARDSVIVNERWLVVVRCRLEYRVQVGTAQYKF